MTKTIERSDSLKFPPEIENDVTRRKFLIGAGSLLVLGASGCGSSGDSGDGEQASGGTRTIEHKFSSAEIPESPERVVTVGYNEADFVLALEIAVPRLGGAMDGDPETESGA